MPQETQSELFIRVLTDAFDDDRLVRMARQSGRSRAMADKHKQLFQSDLSEAMHLIEPMGRAGSPMDMSNKNTWYG